MPFEAILCSSVLTHSFTGERPLNRGEVNAEPRRNRYEEPRHGNRGLENYQDGEGMKWCVEHWLCVPAYT